MKSTYLACNYIMDFPAYANLSGWSTKGKFGCPICNMECSSYRLQIGRKLCCMGHRQFLLSDHKFQRYKRSFDENEEHRIAPKELSGEDVLHQLDPIEHVTLGKTSKNKIKTKRKREHYKPEHNWKKKSIFFQLP